MWARSMEPPLAKNSTSENSCLFLRFYRPTRIVDYLGCCLSGGWGQTLISEPARRYLTLSLSSASRQTFNLIALHFSCSLAVRKNPLCRYLLSRRYRTTSKRGRPVSCREENFALLKMCSDCALSRPCHGAHPCILIRLPWHSRTSI